MNSSTSNNAAFTCSRRLGHGHGHSQRQARPQSHGRSHRPTPRPLPLLEAIEGLSQALSALQASLGANHVSPQVLQNGRHAWPQRQPKQAISMPWLDDAKAVATLETSDELDTDWADDLWTCPWDELSVVELRSLLRCYPIDRRRLPAPIELLRRSELIEALSELQEVSG
jgi:hypothetical protein